jgi:hypothetical protein
MDRPWLAPAARWDSGHSLPVGSGGLPCPSKPTLPTVTNWSEYDAALRQRGSLTIWVTEEAIAARQAEPRTTRGGQPRYSPLAITPAVTLRAVFRLGLRQTEGWSLCAI